MSLFKNLKIHDTYKNYKNFNNLCIRVGNNINKLMIEQK